MEAGGRDWVESGEEGPVAVVQRDAGTFAQNFCSDRCLRPQRAMPRRSPPVRDGAGCCQTSRHSEQLL